jgi:hypothetical protein
VREVDEGIYVMAANREKGRVRRSRANRANRRTVIAGSNEKTRVDLNGVCKK